MHISKHILKISFFLILSISIAAAAEGGAIPSATISEYGIYSLGSYLRRPEINSPTGMVKSTNSPSLIKQTEEVPLAQGVKFGFCFDVEGVGTEGRVELTQSVTHPELVRSNGTKSSSYTMPLYLNIVGGKGHGCTGYGLDQAFELVPGTWHFDISISGKSIAQQQFVVR